LLKEGIKVIPVDKGISSLYRSAAELLGQAGRTDPAVDLLKDGIKVVPPDKSLSSVYQATKLLGHEHEAAADNRLDRDAPLGPMQSGVSASGAPDATPPQAVLLMATEWRSVHGGLSTFNRQLCRALASQGHAVVCVMPSATAHEIDEARRDGVTIAVAAMMAGSAPMSGMVRPLPLPPGFVPSVIVGHGRITGAAAKAQSADHFRNAKRVHFVHMAPGEIEWFKDSDDPAGLSDARERIECELATDANLVVAVGPRLQREFSDLLRGIGTIASVHEFLPGPNPKATSEPPQLNHCLILGRVDDYELKGLDIAARALGHVVQARRYAGTAPELIVRGAIRGTENELRARLRKECPGVDLSVRVREYNSDEGTIGSDLRRAALLLMPSRREGFGLVALEALSHGVPVLVSDTSGFGEVVQRAAPEVLVRNSVVTTPDDVHTAARNWADAIAMQLLDKGASFSRAFDLANHLAQTLGWDAATRTLMARVGADFRA
jgi:glycosyltransferase involved in cell wall biosynthesis